MATGINVSKDVTYVLLGPPTGISVQKDVSHALVGKPKGLSAFKDVTYAFVQDPLYALSHQWSFAGEIDCRITLNSPTRSYNALPSTPPISGRIDLEVPMDVVDFGMEVNHLGGQGITEFYRSMFIIDTADFDGTCTWTYQLVVKNSSSSSQTITLKTITATFDPDTIATSDVLNVTIPAYTTEWTLMIVSFVPTAGLHRYYWSIPDVIGLSVMTGRPVVEQLNASKTLVWRPLCDRGVVSHFNDHMGYNWGTPGVWANSSYGGTFYWNTDLYDAATISIVLEGTLGSSYGGVISGFRLYDITADAAVSGSVFTVTSGGAFRYPQSWVDRHEFNAALLTNGHLYQMQFRRESSWGGGVTTDWLSSSLLGRGAFYIRLSGIVKAEIVWRVAKQSSGPVIDSHGDSRCRIKGIIGPAALLDYVKNETCSAPDYFYAADPVVDYWITDDGTNMSGDGGTATDIPLSNARQEYANPDLLPIFSSDWKDNFVSGNCYCQRVRPVSVGGDANAQWTLILLGIKKAGPWVPPVCPELTPECEPEELPAGCNEPQDSGGICDEPYPEPSGCDEPGEQSAGCSEPSEETTWL